MMVPFCLFQSPETNRDLKIKRNSKAKQKYESQASLSLCKESSIMARRLQYAMIGNHNGYSVEQQSRLLLICACGFIINSYGKELKIHLF